MHILYRGVSLDEYIYECPSCSSILQFRRSECTILWNETRLPIAYCLDCPVCFGRIKIEASWIANWEFNKIEMKQRLAERGVK